jgi:hypothetical protein
MAKTLAAHAPFSLPARQRRILVAITAIGSVLAAGLMVLGPNPFSSVGASTVTETIFGSAQPTVGDSSDVQSVELGTRFDVTTPGRITGIRYWKSLRNTGAHTGTLWTASGTALAHVTFNHESKSGWQNARLSTPIWVQPGQSYVVSYHTSTGHYADDAGYFAGRGAGPAHVKAPPDSGTAANSIYRYGTTTGFPTSTWKSSNYWVDVAFTPGKSNPAGSTTTTTAPATTSTTRATTTTTSLATTTTTMPATTTTTVPGGPPTNCPLKVGADACWAAATGVPGWTEAQILSGASPLKHVVGDITVTQPGTVISNEWIDGCIAIKASNVTIQNSLIHSANKCHGGNGQSGGAAIDTGNDPSALSGVQVIDTEVDGISAPSDDQGVGTVSLTCLRCNVHGYTKDVWMSDGMSVIDSYIHDQAAAGAAHTEPVMIDGGDNVLLQHSYVKSTPGQDYTTGAIGLLSDYGGSSHVRLINNYAEGGSGWDLSGGAPYGTYITITGNALSPINGWGGTDYWKYYDPSGTGNVWSNNYNSETLAPINP